MGPKATISRSLRTPKSVNMGPPREGGQIVGSAACMESPEDSRKPITTVLGSFRVTFTICYSCRAHFVEIERNIDKLQWMVLMNRGGIVTKSQLAYVHGKPTFTFMLPEKPEWDIFYEGFFLFYAEHTMLAALSVVDGKKIEQASNTSFVDSDGRQVRNGLQVIENCPVLLYFSV